SSNYGSKLRALSDGGEAVIGRRAYSCHTAPRVGPRGPWPSQFVTLFFRDKTPQIVVNQNALPLRANLGTNHSKVLPPQECRWRGTAKPPSRFVRFAQTGSRCAAC